MELWIYNEGEKTGYRLLEEVARGGEGDTWRAEQIGPVGRPILVAVKVLDPDRYLGKAGVDPDAVLDRWRGHAQVLRAFNQPGFATVQVAFQISAKHDQGAQTPPQWLGRPAFVMGWIEGLPLSKWDGSSLQPVERLSVLELCAQALDAFHGKTTHVHRDLKPSNIIVSPEKIGTIIDFGLVRSMEQIRGASTLAGSRGYIAPELYEGAEYSAATDLFAFAGILFYLLVGRHPPETGPASRTRELLANAGCGRCGPLLGDALAPHPNQRPELAGATELLGLVSERLAGARSPHESGTPSRASSETAKTVRDTHSSSPTVSISGVSDAEPVLRTVPFLERLAKLTPLHRALLLSAVVCALTIVVAIAVRATA